MRHEFSINPKTETYLLPKTCVPPKTANAQNYLYATKKYCSEKMKFFFLPVFMSGERKSIIALDWVTKGMRFKCSCRSTLSRYIYIVNIDILLTLLGIVIELNC